MIGRPAARTLAASEEGVQVASEDALTERLRDVYEISSLLADFESVERTIPAVLSIVSRGLPLRRATVTRSRGAGTRELRWSALTGPGAEDLAIEASSETTTPHWTLAYLGLANAADATMAKRKTESGPVVVLPLSLADGVIFGALVFELVSRPDERDVMFANAVVNQLAVALVRHEDSLAQRRFVDASRVAAEVRESSLRWIANASSLLATSADVEYTLSRLARLAIPDMGDVCLVDIAHDGSRMRRVSATSAPRFESAEGIALPPVPDARRVDIAVREDSGAIRAAGLSSMMSIPLVVADLYLGTLAFLAEEANRYSLDDLAVAKEVGRQTAWMLYLARRERVSKAAIKSREELMEFVSHDFRNPLSVVSMMVSTMMRDPQVGARSHQHLEIIKRATSQMNVLVADLLDSASMQAGRFAIRRQRVAVAPIVAGAIEAVEPLAARKSLFLECEVEDSLPALDADVFRIQQVFANLLGNAVKFTPKLGTITTRAYRSTAREGTRGGVTFSVRDSGPGIPEADKAHLFDRFWQAEETAKHGTGLGLFIARAIVLAHGGKIWVESALGAGCTFFFEVPEAADVDGTNSSIAKLA